VNAELLSIIALIPAWSGAEINGVERVAGLTNVNYRMLVKGEPFFLRTSGENAQCLGINREQEYTALKNAAALGLGPDVVAFLLPEGHLVTRWIDGRHWSASEFRTPDNVCLLTETVKRIHQLPSNGAVFSPFRWVEAYIKTARDYNVPLPENLAEFIETMQAVEIEQQRDPSDWRRFCHNDLVSVNYLICDGSGDRFPESAESPAGHEKNIKIIDWEFAGLGNIYYDLATVVYTHDSDGPIPPDLEEVMLACYFGQFTQHQRKRLNGMEYMLMLFTGMWGLAQYGMQRARLIQPVGGFDYLEFAQYLFTHDIREPQRICTD
jgi:thiamine kinase-like enzyme